MTKTERQKANELACVLLQNGFARAEVMAELMSKLGLMKYQARRVVHKVEIALATLKNPQDGQIQQ